jgi:hypothetical protein
MGETGTDKAGEAKPWPGRIAEPWPGSGLWPYRLACGVETGGIAQVPLALFF